MNILMFTNTFLPHVGGVTRSILTLRAELERRGHNVMVIAPAYEGHSGDAPGILRVPALRRLTRSGYAAPIPLSRHIRDEILAFGPDVIHAHHPFLLGDTALRTAASLGVPAVYTCHTRYDLYLGSNTSEDSRLARLMRRLTVGFADLADAVIAPSESIRDMLVEQGVSSPIRIIPTGIDLVRLGEGDGAAMRARLGLAPDAFVVGHLGRLTPEKNLDYLAEAVGLYLHGDSAARFIVAGEGPCKAALAARCERLGVARQLTILGNLEADELADFYAAMDVFAFASRSETQGLVVAEAMAAGTPVVVLDAPGVRETMAGVTAGALLAADSPATVFAKALAGMAALTPAARAGQRSIARAAATAFSVGVMGDAAEALYGELAEANRPILPRDRRRWEGAWDGVAREADIVENLLSAIGTAVRPAPVNGAGASGTRDWEAESPIRRTAVAATAWLWVLALKAWRATWRADLHEAARLDAALADGERVVAVFWHGNYLPLFTLLADRPGLVATSRSFRGAVIAGIARRFGYRTVQVGGSGRDAGGWLRAELTHPGRMVAIAVDGPLGPRHVVKPGAVAIAARTGAKIIPVAAEASAALRLSNRWDRMELPLPLARVTIRVGAPIEVTARERDDIEAEARLVAERLLALRPKDGAATR